MFNSGLFLLNTDSLVKDLLFPDPEVSDIQSESTKVHGSGKEWVTKNTSEVKRPTWEGDTGGRHRCSMAAGRMGAPSTPLLAAARLGSGDTPCTMCPEQKGCRRGPSDGGQLPGLVGKHLSPTTRSAFISSGLSSSLNVGNSRQPCSSVSSMPTRGGVHLPCPTTHEPFLSPAQEEGTLVLCQRGAAAGKAEAQGLEGRGSLTTDDMLASAGNPKGPTSSYWNY